MRRTRGEERWVGACIEAALPGVTVRMHDDGSANAMHDLDLLRGGEVFAACEVTAAADRRSIELWNVVNGTHERWIEPGLAGGWSLHLDPDRCRARDLTRKAPSLLERLERDPFDQEASRALKALGVTSIYQSPTSFPGSIYLTIERDSTLTSGFVADTGDGLVTWFDGWIRTDDQAHNLAKLDAAQAPERHLFVLLPGFTSAPFTASDLLMVDDRPLPAVAPSLPHPLTHIWFMSTWQSGPVVRWSPGGWASHPKVFEALTHRSRM